MTRLRYVVYLLVGLGLAAACQPQAEQQTGAGPGLRQVTAKREMTRLYRADTALNDTLGSSMATISLAYPVWETGGPAAARDSFNRFIRSFVGGLMQAHVTQRGIDTTYAQPRDTVVLKRDEARNYSVPGFSTGLSVAYDAYLVNADFIGLEFDVDQYLGGAHGMQFAHTFLFDLAQNRMLTLQDFFKPGSPYQQALSDLCRADLLARKDQIMTDSSNIWSGTAPAQMDSLSFRAQPDGLRFLFNPYAVAAYAAGPQTVLVPYQKLADHLAPDGPAAKLKK